jgi:hypothetical protein
MKNFIQNKLIDYFNNKIQIMCIFIHLVSKNSHIVNVRRTI